MNENNPIENTELTSLPNIGKEMNKQLRAVGINTPEELVATGSREAWLRIPSHCASACYNHLCGLEGASPAEESVIRNFRITTSDGKNYNTKQDNPLAIK